MPHCIKILKDDCVIFTILGSSVGEGSIYYYSCKYVTKQLTLGNIMLLLDTLSTEQKISYGSRQIYGQYHSCGQL